jgi:hypothetical protein
LKPTQEQFAAYQQVFDHFNRSLFENSLPECMLSFSRRRHSPHTLFTAGQWRKDASSVTPEISLNIKQMSQRQIKNPTDIQRKRPINASAAGQNSGAKAGWAWSANAVMFLQMKQAR